MLADVVDLLRCHRCAAPVAVLDATVLACRSGHRHDIARHGHVNLLSTAAPANADTAAMVAARESYLAAGPHDALRQVLVERAGTTVLDAGCGPGWYFAGLPPTSRVVGLDLSAAAARRAARAHPRAGVLVCDLRDPWPVADRAVDTVWCVFAPRNPSEYRRVLRPSGELVVAIPAPDHLAELRDSGSVLGIQPEKESRLLAQLAHQGWTATWRELVRQTITPNRAMLEAVVAMGPSAHHGLTGPVSAAQLTVSAVVLGFSPGR